MAARDNGAAGDRGDPVVRVHGLRKSYDGYEAVAGVDFAIPRGTVFGLLAWRSSERDYAKAVAALTATL